MNFHVIVSAHLPPSKKYDEIHYLEYISFYHMIPHENIVFTQLERREIRFSYFVKIS